jgi:acyl-CoA thioester hydrolase
MGVVHHSVYLVWFELARTRLCLESGHHYADVERLGYYLVVTRTEARYLEGAGYGETVRVVCWLDKMGSRGLRFAYEVRRDGRVLASGTTEHVWVERASGRPCRIPAVLEGPFRRLAGEGPMSASGEEN